MNVFNRLIMFLLGLAALAYGIITLLLLSHIISPAQASIQGALQGQWQFFTRLQGSGATAAAIVGWVLAVVGALVALLELLPGPREPARFVVRQDPLGRVTVARSSVQDLVRHEAAAVPGVLEVRPAVARGKKGLRVSVRSSVEPTVIAPEVGEALQQQVKEAVQRHIGLPVAEVHVTTQLEPLDGARRRVR